MDKRMEVRALLVYTIYESCRDGLNSIPSLNKLSVIKDYLKSHGRLFIKKMNNVFT